MKITGNISCIISICFRNWWFKKKKPTIFAIHTLAMGIQRTEVAEQIDGGHRSTDVYMCHVLCFALCVFFSFWYLHKIFLFTEPMLFTWNKTKKAETNRIRHRSTRQNVIKLIFTFSPEHSATQQEERQTKRLQITDSAMSLVVYESTTNMRLTNALCDYFTFLLWFMITAK